MQTAGLFFQPWTWQAPPSHHGHDQVAAGRGYRHLSTNILGPSSDPLLFLSHPESASLSILFLLITRTKIIFSSKRQFKFYLLAFRWILGGLYLLFELLVFKLQALGFVWYKKMSSSDLFIFLHILHIKPILRHYVDEKFVVILILG